MDDPLANDDTRPAPAVVYPDSDGQPMADNTEQFLFIQMVQGNLDASLDDFVAGDHLWYPVEGRPDIRVAPGVYVALGRPKGHRGSYKQWEEDGVPPRVVFEWWSPNNDFPHQAGKLRFYDRYGVEEFYTFDQLRQVFSAFIRQGEQLEPVSTEGGFTSPLLGVRFEVIAGQLKACHPDGRPFRTMAELEAERARLKLEHGKAEQELKKAEQEREEAEARAAGLAERLRALGADPDAL